MIPRVLVPKLRDFEQRMFCAPSIRIAAWLFPWQTASVFTGWMSRVAVRGLLHPRAGYWYSSAVARYVGERYVKRRG